MSGEEKKKERKEEKKKKDSHGITMVLRFICQVCLSALGSTPGQVFGQS